MKIETDDERLSRLANEHTRLNNRLDEILSEVMAEANTAFYKCSALKRILEDTQARSRSAHGTERTTYDELSKELQARIEHVLQQHPWIRKDFPT